jgi:hypothetical protein
VSHVLFVFRTETEPLTLSYDSLGSSSAQLMLMAMSKTEIANFKDKWIGSNRQSHHQQRALDKDRKLTPVSVYSAIVMWHPICFAMIRFYVLLFQFEVDVLQLEMASSGQQPDLTQMQPQTLARGTFSGFDTASPGSEQVVAFS